MNERADGGTVAVTGANSAVGKALLAHIADQDTVRAVALVRREAALEGLPRSPRIASRVVTYEQPERLVEVLTGAGCVVHLAGILFESRTTSYRTGNVESTRALVAAAQSAGVRHIVLVSSLGADPRSSNGYFRSKGEAERLVIGSGLKATIIRTPLLLGPGNGRRARAAAHRGRQVRPRPGGRVAPAAPARRRRSVPRHPGLLPGVGRRRTDLRHGRPDHPHPA